VSGLERCPGCHPERSEGSRGPAGEILPLRCRSGLRLTALRACPGRYSLQKLKKYNKFYCSLDN